jgi:DNA-binding SARP family transcriptional activator
MLGSLRVRRADGSDVLSDEWRTKKTRDLLRVLALADAQPVRVSTLLDRLWPNATENAARNRLRTAASQIRRTLGDSTCLVRESDGLRLQHVTVDVSTFRALAQRADLASRIGASSDVLDSARTAQLLYRGDFHADNDDDWAVEERGHLQKIHQDLLCDAAVAALDLGLFREALGLASHTVQLDPTSETAHRALMQAHAELGEVATALRVFEAYRRHLADELGVDPSPQTMALHLRLLQGDTRQAAGSVRR